MTTTVLLTGATGYIGSHTWLVLQAAGMKVLGLDNFSNSTPEVLNRLAGLGGETPAFERVDVCDRSALSQVFDRHAIDAVVHFAAFKAVGESARQPLRYFTNNLGGLLSLCEVMQAHACRHLVFSSSATVYGAAQHLPIKEDAALLATSPYGETKLMGETILRSLQRADPQWAVADLRYFNPVGAHESGMLGEDPHGVPNNLMPYVSKVAMGELDSLQVFGGDYDTPDGTGVRDYIHVTDLALGHLAALRHLLQTHQSLTVNLGTGLGHSVLELVRAFEKASQRPVPYRIVPRRPGDVAACYADPALARALLGWQAHRNLATMCDDSWRWQRRNPQGYATR